MTLKFKTVINRHSPKPSSVSSQIPDPPYFSLPTTFKGSDGLVDSLNTLIFLGSF
jgi:hypothetical protein